MKKTIYSLLFIAVLIFVGACDYIDCQGENDPPPAHADNAWVACFKGPDSQIYLPKLFDLLGPVDAQDFHDQDYDCNQTGSPPQPNSSRPVYPDGIGITPDGMRAYITSLNTTNPVVQMIDLATRKVTATIPASQYPQGAFMSPDGAHVWITYPLGGTVNVIDTLTNTDVTGLGIQGPYAVAFNSTGTRAYISSQSGASGTVQ